MNTYLINTVLGFMVVMGKTAKQAYFKYLTEETMIGDACLDRKDLLERGYTKIETTSLENVFELMK